MSGTFLKKAYFELIRIQFTKPLESGDGSASFSSIGQLFFCPERFECSFFVYCKQRCSSNKVLSLFDYLWSQNCNNHCQQTSDVSPIRISIRCTHYFIISKIIYIEMWVDASTKSHDQFPNFLVFEDILGRCDIGYRLPP